jgi:hypothetical protein
LLELTPQAARILSEIVVQPSQDYQQRPAAEDDEQPHNNVRARRIVAGWSAPC